MQSSLGYANCIHIALHRLHRKMSKRFSPKAVIPDRQGFGCFCLFSALLECLTLSLLQECRREELGFLGQTTLALPLITSEPWASYSNLSEPKSPPMKTGDGNTFPTELLWGLNEMVRVTHSAQCPAPSLTDSQCYDCHFTVPPTQRHIVFFLKIDDRDSLLTTGFGILYTLKFPINYPHWWFTLMSGYRSLPLGQDTPWDGPSHSGPLLMPSRKVLLLQGLIQARFLGSHVQNEVKISQQPFWAGPGQPRLGQRRGEEGTGGSFVRRWQTQSYF